MFPFQLVLKTSWMFPSNCSWGCHALLPSSCSWKCHAMFPSNCSWGCHASFSSFDSKQCFLQCNVFFQTVPGDTMKCLLSNCFRRWHAMFPFELVLKASCNVSFQLFVTSCTVSFQLVLKTSCNVSFQLFLRCHKIFPSNFMALKMSCNLFFSSYPDAMQCMSFPNWFHGLSVLLLQIFNYMFNFWSFRCHISNIFKFIPMSQSRKSAR